MPMKTGFRVALVVLTAAVLQRGFFSQVRVASVAADLLLLLAIVAGLTGGSDRGAIMGFLCGLMLDLLLQTPLGLAALAYCIVGFVAARYQQSVTRSSKARLMATVAVASALGQAFLAVTGWLLGQRNMLSPRLILVAVVTASINGLLAPLAATVLRWVWDQPQVRRFGVRYGR